jgi:putative membrane protein
LASTERTLIVCIDGDDDIGTKGGIVTPIVGRDETLHSAMALAISDPEEADANAMFGAVKLYDTMMKQHPEESFEVSTISGSSRGGVEADRKMVKELNQVLEAFDATGVILVTDGFADEELVPIVQSRVPITSIHHVVVKHSERIEETWAVLFRYLRMLVEDPYYSKVSLGVPGVLLVLFGFLMASGQVENAGMMVAFVMGVVLFLKGFGLDERLVAMRPRLPPAERWLTLLSKGFGAILGVLGSYQGIVHAWTFLPSPAQPFWDLSFWASHLPDLAAAFFMRGTDLMALGIGVVIIGDAASDYILERKTISMWENVVGLIFLFWMRLIVLESAEVLMNPEITVTLFSPLIFYTVAGVATTIIAVVLIYKRFGREAFVRSPPGES